MTRADGSEGLRVIADRLAARREALLEKVRADVTSDPEMSTSKTLTRENFRDNLPGILDALVQRLRNAAMGSRCAESPERIPAEMHGAHRWQEGYSLTEAVSEWRHLSKCVIEEFGEYARRDAAISSAALVAAMCELSELIADGVAASTQQHAFLQRAEATRRRDELQVALDQLRSLEDKRSEIWRQAVHDLRGSVGAISNASALLERSDASAIRELSQGALSRGLTSVRQLLEELATLARLEAGQDQLRISRFDASELLRELAITVRPLALERGLRFEANGPESLELEGDPVKVQRIAQNLVLNAFKYTQEGGVWVSWSADDEAPQERWVLIVQDSGPGMEATSSPPPTSTGMSPDQALPTGEGIGLSIVRHLCDLLGARLECDSQRSRGTTFRLIFPRRYPQ